MAHLRAEAASVEQRKAPRDKVRALTTDAVAALTHAPDPATPQGRRDAALLSTLYATGCRVSEVLGIQVRDLHLDGDAPYAMVRGKGGGSRVAYMRERAASQLREHVRESLGESPSPDAYVFWSREGGGPGARPLSPAAVTKMMQRHARAAHESCPDLPVKVTPHRLRHARATHWLEEGMGVAQVSLLLGHKSVQTTMEYLDVSPESMAEAMRRVPGSPEEPGEKRWKGKDGGDLVDFCGFRSPIR